MQVREETITPAIAAAFLESNTGNRVLRPGTVKTWLQIYRRGEYVTTHQGIAFDTDGRLIDGQHRLTAIRQMPEDFCVRMLVARDCDSQSYLCIDQGLYRTAADVLGEDRRLTGVARHFVAVHQGYSMGITVQKIGPLVESLRAPFLRLRNFNSRFRKTWGSTPVLAATLLRICTIPAEEEYFLLSFRALNAIEVDYMSPRVAALFQQVERTNPDRSHGDLFLRAYRALDPKERTTASIVIRDRESLLEEVREAIGRIKGGPPSPPRRSTPAAPETATAQAS